MIATMRRMYRNFYFRLCDIVDSARLLESDKIEDDNLHATSGRVLQPVFSSSQTMLRVTEEKGWTFHVICVIPRLSAAIIFTSVEVF